MSSGCSIPTCGVADGLGCDNGESVLKNCPNYRNAAESNLQTVSPSGSAADDSSIRLPWSGRALGLQDIILASARSPTELIALVGPYNAGKTALLTALFVHMAKSGEIAGHDFAGSFTLEGWSRLRDYTKWPALHGHAFPPHTPDSNDRVPSLLHLAFRRGTESVRDYLFTDAPGEWFTRWLKNRNADDAKGARWIVEHATRFVYVVDREALAGSERGIVRHTTQALARLLAEHRSGRPVIAAWTKSDLSLNEVSEQPVRKGLQDLFGNHPSMNVMVGDDHCVELLSHLLEPIPKAIHVPSRIAYASPFLAYQGGTL